MATTDEMGLEMSPEEDAVPLSEEPLGQRRRHAREILSSQHLYLDRLEDELGERVQRLADEIGRELAQEASSQAHAVDDGRVAALEAQVEELRQQLSSRQNEVAQAREACEQARTELGRSEQDARIREALLADAQGEQEKRRLELAARGEELADAQAQVAAARTNSEKLRGELTSLAEQLAAEQEKAQAQARLARKLKTQATHDKAELDERLAQATVALQRQLDEQAAEFEKRYAQQAADFERRQADHATQMGERQRHELDEIGRLQADEAASLARQQAEQLAHLDQQLAQRVADTQRLEAQVAALSSELETARNKQSAAQADPSAARALEAQLQALRAERDALAKKLKAVEASASEHAGSEADTREKDELQRRLEMAVEELREAKRANSDLQAKLARKGGDISGGAPGALNWEAQKERLLASLEADDRDDEEAAEERQTIEGTIRITDQMVAQKDREIAELKRQVGDGSAHQQAAAADLLDHDETIRAEREKLQKAQEEWRQRIGQAEIDISVERAKLARERLELEEKSRVLQAEQAKCAPQGPSSGEPAKPQRGRWLARLGLKDLDDKS